MSTKLATPSRLPLSAPAGPFTSPRWALIALSSATLLSSLDTSIANVALPTLALSFAASFQEIQWVILSYLLVITTIIVSVGRLGDIVGHRRLMLTGITVFTIASAICGIAPTLAVLIGARAVQGVGGAVMMVLPLALARQNGPAKSTGYAIGILGTMSAVGTALGPSVGGVMIAAWGWRSIFLVNLPVAAFTLILTYRALPPDSEQHSAMKRGFDSIGTVLLAITLAAYMLAMTLGRGNFSALNISLLFVSSFALWLFIRSQSKTVSPLIALGMFRDRVFGAALSVNVLVATVVTTTLVVGPFYLTRALGLTPARVGLVLSAGPLVAAFTATPASRLIDRFGLQFVAVAGLIAMAIGSAFLSLGPASLGAAGYVAPIVLLTAGYGLYQTANNTAVMKGAEGERQGVVSGLLNLSRNLGRITGAAVMGAVFAFASATSDLASASPADVTTGLHASFRASTLLMITALILAIVFHRPEPAPKLVLENAPLSGARVDLKT